MYLNLYFYTFKISQKKKVKKKSVRRPKMKIDLRRTFEVDFSSTHSTFLGM